MGTSTTDYLGLVYGISIFLASAAGMGAAFLGNRIYPLKGGDDKPPPTPAEVAAAVKKAEKADTEASKLADKLAESGKPLPELEPEKEEVEPEPEKEEEEKTEPEPEEKEEEVESIPEPEKEEEEEVESIPEPEKEEEEKTEPEPEEKEEEVEPEPANKEYIAKIEKDLDVSPEIAEDIFTIINTPTAVVNTLPDIAAKFKAIKEALTEKHEDVAKLVASKILSFQTPSEISDDVFVKDLHELVPPS